MTKKVRYDKRLGEKFGKLTITSVDGYAEKDNSKRYRIGTVTCECGSEFTARLADVVSGNTSSCGCRRRKHADKAVMRMYSNYASNAKARGYIFELSHQEFHNLIENECHYCGIKPSHELHYKGESHVVNGIDRVDNDNGYTFDNVVTCCSVCNQAKHTLPYDAFISWIGRLKAHEIKDDKRAVILVQAKK